MLKIGWTWFSVAFSVRCWHNLSLVSIFSINCYYGSNSNSLVEQNENYSYFQWKDICGKLQRVKFMIKDWEYSVHFFFKTMLTRIISVICVPGLLSFQVQTIMPWWWAERSLPEWESSLQVHLWASDDCSFLL